MICLGMHTLGPDVPLPSYGTDYSTCFDLIFYPTQRIVNGYSRSNEQIERFVAEKGEILISPGDRLLLPTGLVMQLEAKVTIEDFADITAYSKDVKLQNYSIRLHARSGLALKRGLVLANAEGVVDADYQHEVFVMMTNISDVGAVIKTGDRIAQGEVVSNVPAKLVKLEEFPKPLGNRTGGFGSTGLQIPTQKYELSYETPPMEEWKVDGPTNFG